MTTEFEAAATELSTLKSRLAAFRAENEEVLATIKRMNAEISEKKSEIMELLEASGEEKMEHEGVVYKLKKRTRQVHDVDALASIVEDKDKYDEYLKSVEQVSSSMVTTTNKRARKRSNALVDVEPSQVEE